MKEKLIVSTIGFTKSSARHFFDRILSSGSKSVIDVRLNNTSQLSGFAKSDDLRYFLEKLGRISYRHLPILAPEEKMLKEYKKNGGSWAIYERQFLDLMSSRKIEDRIDPDMLSSSCLLCSESTPHNCHRRLVCEYLNKHWDGRLIVRHL